MKTLFALVPLLAVIAIQSCQSVANTHPENSIVRDSTVASVTATADSLNVKATTGSFNTAAIMAMPEVPVLCYHQIREWKSHESRLAKDVVVPPAVFRSQMQALADSGYQTILPDDLYNYLTKGTPLPPKPVMLTYDDGDVDQYNIAAPEMKKHGFKGVFFIMTISMGRSIYMSKEQIKELSDAGNTIASHTWTHQNLKKFKPEDWDQQIVKSCKQLEEITGKPVDYFAYPFGVWTPEGIPELKSRNIKAAFQLSTKRDSTEPLHTIRRMIVPGDWSAGSMIRAMKKTFKS